VRRLGRKKDKKSKNKDIKMERVFRAYIIAATIKYITYQRDGIADPKAFALAAQATKAMKVFGIKVGVKKTIKVSTIGSDAYKETIGKIIEYLTIDEVCVLIEMVYNLSSQSDMKEFLLVSYSTSNAVRDEIKSALLSSVLSFDRYINEELYLKPYTTREKLGAIMCKPVPVTKAKKEKKREPSKAHKKHLAFVQKYKETKNKNMSILRERIAKAKSMAKCS